MTKQGFFTITAFIFLAIAVLHALRLAYGWEAVIGGAVIPAWVSWIALVVAALLAWSGFTLGRKR